MSGKTFRQDTRIHKVFRQDTQIQKIFKKDDNVFSSGYIVMYHVDVDNVIPWEVDDGADCITSAPPAIKPGYTIYGWREDTVASQDVLEHKTCDGEGIVLYAVFTRVLQIQLVGGNATVISTGTQYYNNSNTLDPSITLGTASRDSWNLTGYRRDTEPVGEVPYLAGQSYVFSNNTILYAVFQQTIRLIYNGNGNTGGSTATQINYRYYNNGNISNPSFIVSANGYTKTNYGFIQWRRGSTSGTIYKPGDSVTLSESVTFYAEWLQEIFPYTGNIQTYTVKYTGVYQLEVWGGQGGSAHGQNEHGAYNWGGKGGYSIGRANLTAGSTIYVVVGGAGDNGSCNGWGGTNNKGDGTGAAGYNGGGHGTLGVWGAYAAGGGGATHIATRTGLLKDLDGYRSSIYLVAGGGGGANEASQSIVVGDGGGLEGGRGGDVWPSGTYVNGGTQTTGYAFGLGENGKAWHYGWDEPEYSDDYREDNPGGGGGWYGGDGGCKGDGNITQGSGGGGGSGYIGGVSNGSTTAGQREGHGQARIIPISIS